MSKLLFASLIALTTTTAASAQAIRPPIPPGPPTHRPSFPGDCTTFRASPLVEIDQKEPDGTLTARTTVFITGGWQHDELDAKGKTTLSMSGCLAKADYDSLAEELAKTPWTISYNAATCMAVSSSIEYAYRGKSVWTKQLCELGYLDDVSAKTERDLDALNAKLSAHVGPAFWKGHKPS